jgi:hypothetical protein
MQPKSLGVACLHRLALMVKLCERGQQRVLCCDGMQHRLWCMAILRMMWMSSNRS